MKKLLTLTVISCLLFAIPSFAFFDSHPKIDVKHIEKDIIGHTIQAWKVEGKMPTVIEILDSKYDQDIAIIYVFLKVTDVEYKKGREGKLRLQYEYAADDWNLLNIKPITFNDLDLKGARIIKMKLLYPFHYAALDGNLAAVKSFLVKGTNIESVNDIGSTALSCAAFNDQLHVVKYLLNNGANVNARNNTEFTPLHAAAINGNTEMVRTFIDRGADVNAKNKNGNTALMFAASRGHAETVQTLVEKGATLDDENQKGRTAYSIAVSKKHTDVTKILIDKGAGGWGILCNVLIDLELHFLKSDSVLPLKLKPNQRLFLPENMGWIEVDCLRDNYMKMGPAVTITRCLTTETKPSRVWAFLRFPKFGKENHKDNVHTQEFYVFKDFKLK